MYNNDNNNLFDANGEYHLTYPESSGYTLNENYQPPMKQKKPRKAPRYIAAGLAMVLMSAAAGGGGAWLVMNYADPPATTTETAAPVIQAVQPTNATSASSGATDITAVVSATENSVVEISTESVQYNMFIGNSVAEGAGSGVIISEDGYIVTNDHVVADTQNIIVRTKDGTEYQAKLVGTDSKTDLAVLKIEATGLTPAVFADSDSIQVGQLAVAIGNPLGELGGTVTSGIISATGREINIGGESMNLLQTSAAVNPGNSGGGLFNSDGQLVGVVNAKSSGSGVEGLAFAIPSNTVREVADSIIANGYVAGRPQMGIQVIEISGQQMAMYYQVREPGVYISSPGNNAGLKAGDRIVKIGDTEITSSNDVSNAVNAHSVGDTITIVVNRDGENVETQVTLTEQVPEGVVASRI